MAHLFCSWGPHLNSSGGETVGDSHLIDISYNLFDMVLIDGSFFCFESPCYHREGALVLDFLAFR